MGRHRIRREVLYEAHDSTTPVPGTAIRVERERDAIIQKRARMLQQAIDDIETSKIRLLSIKVWGGMIATQRVVHSTIGTRSP